MRFSIINRVTSLLIVIGMPLHLSPIGLSHAKLEHQPAEATLSSPMFDQNGLMDCYSIFLPNILAGNSDSRTEKDKESGHKAIREFGAPSFEIITPAPGSTVSGVSTFAIQPGIGSGVTTVSFSAGSVDLGTDNTASDGFETFIDTSALSDGEMTLTATASNLCGSTSKSITVGISSSTGMVITSIGREEP